MASTLTVQLRHFCFNILNAISLSRILLDNRFTPSLGVDFDMDSKKQLLPSHTHYKRTCPDIHVDIIVDSYSTYSILALIRYRPNEILIKLSNWCILA